MVDTTGLSPVEQYARGGSSPLSRTKKQVEWFDPTEGMLTCLSVKGYAYPLMVAGVMVAHLRILFGGSHEYKRKGTDR